MRMQIFSLSHRVRTMTSKLAAKVELNNVCISRILALSGTISIATTATADYRLNKVNKCEINISQLNVRHRRDSRRKTDSTRVVRSGSSSAPFSPAQLCLALLSCAAAAAVDIRSLALTKK